MRRYRFHSLLLIVLLTVLGIFSGLITQLVPDAIPEKLKNISLRGWSFGWIWAGALVFVSILTAVAIFIKERFDSVDEGTEDTTNETKDQKVRRELLNDLLRRYEGRRAHKLDQRSELPLVISDGSKNTRPERVEDAGDFLIRHYEHNGRLILVGKPGSGKTMLLLKLAMYLVEKAQKDPTEPLPIILNLAAWSAKYSDFNNWTSMMLTKGYGLSEKVARKLLDERTIVFLLDGLDELGRNEEPETATRMRLSCLSSLVAALSHGSISVVICCRVEEYDLLRSRPDLQKLWVAELIVEDLGPEQIDLALIRISAEKTDRFAVRNLNMALGADDAATYQQVLATPFYLDKILFHPSA